MVKKTVKTDKVLAAFRVLNTAKYAKMDDEDKIKVWKIARVLKPIVTEFDDMIKDASEKLKPSVEGFDEKYEKFLRFQQMVRIPNVDAKTLPMGIEEFNQFATEVVVPYNKLVEEAVKEFNEKDSEVEFEPLTDTAFAKLMASNEWTVEQAMEIGMLIV